MAKTIFVGGYGPGISKAVAEKFGAEGFTVALVARNADRLAAGVKELEAKGIKAAAFPVDLSDPAAVRGAIGKVRETLGPITVVQWNAYSTGAGDLLTATAEEFRSVLDIATVSLVAAVQAALPDLKASKESAVLVTNGGLGFFEDQVDAMGVNWNVMGLSVANSAKHKIVRLLSQKLKSDGVYVGEVIVLGMVKGTAFDSGNATIEPATVAARFFELYRARTAMTTQVG
jgi:NADP-dependent 3-hydroxy acid dehydrogenase YdfG